jgi:hypothetical protein
LLEIGAHWPGQQIWSPGLAVRAQSAPLRGLMSLSPPYRSATVASAVARPDPGAAAAARYSLTWAFAVIVCSTTEGFAFGLHAPFELRRAMNVSLTSALAVPLMPAYLPVP